MAKDEEEEEEDVGGERRAEGSGLGESVEEMVGVPFASAKADLRKLERTMSAWHVAWYIYRRLQR